MLQVPLLSACYVIPQKFSACIGRNLKKFLQNRQVRLTREIKNRLAVIDDSRDFRPQKKRIERASPRINLRTDDDIGNWKSVVSLIKKAN